jgi:hypothetical protein
VKISLQNFSIFQKLSKHPLRHLKIRLGDASSRFQAHAILMSENNNSLNNSVQTGGDIVKVRSLSEVKTILKRFIGSCRRLCLSLDLADS